MQIIENASQIDSIRSTIIVQGDDREKIVDTDTRKAVLRYASSKGMNNPGISDVGHPFPVAEDGAQLPPGQSPTKDTKFQSEYVIIAGI